MRIFEEFPSNQICPICKTNENKSCGLIGKEVIDYDTENGFEEECIVVHIDCLDLVIGDIGGCRKMITHSKPIMEEYDES